MKDKKAKRQGEAKFKQAKKTLRKGGGAAPGRVEAPRAKPRAPVGGDVPRCGLCGKTENLTRTECCGNWICDDEDNYVPFSYARNCCHRNHSRYTLCGYHHNEGHKGDWKTCPECRKSQQMEMYVYYGTNEYNFEVLSDPPSFKPTLCAKCGKRIVLSEDGYSYGSKGYTCMRCDPL